MVVAGKVINLRTSQKDELVDITPQIISVVKDAAIDEGACIIYCPHTTAGLTINENADPSVKRDILKGLDHMIPPINFTHAEGNSPAHIKAGIMGFSLQVLIQDGALVLGTWQGIYFCEFDGPRNRKLHLQIMS